MVERNAELGGPSLELMGYPSQTKRWLQQSSPCMSVLERVMVIFGLNP